MGMYRCNGMGICKKGIKDHNTSEICKNAGCEWTPIRCNHEWVVTRDAWSRKSLTDEEKKSYPGLMAALFIKIKATTDTVKKLESELKELFQNRATCTSGKRKLASSAPSLQGTS